MKKLLTLLAVGMFALAACVPTNIATAGNNAGPIEENIPDSAMATEDSSSDDSMDDSSDTSGSDMNSSESSDSSDSMDDSSSSESYDDSSMDDRSGYTVNVLIENQSFSPQELTLHEGSVIQWTNNDDVSYTISIMKVSDSSDDSMDDSSDDSYDDSSDDSMDDSSYAYEVTVAPGETVSYTLPDSGLYEFTISGGASLSGIVHVSDSYNDDQYDDDYMDDSYDDSSDDSYDDSSDDSYDDSSDDSYDDDSSDDSYDDSSDDSSDDSYEDDYEDSEDDPESFLFIFVA